MRTAAIVVCLAAGLTGPASPAGDLAAAVEAAFNGCDAGPLVAHLPPDRPIILDAPAAGVPRGTYSDRQARSALDRILARHCGGRFEIVAGRSEGVLVGRWSLPAGRGRGPDSLRVSVSRTGSLVREIRVEP